MASVAEPRFVAGPKLEGIGFQSPGVAQIEGDQRWFRRLWLLPVHQSQFSRSAGERHQAVMSNAVGCRLFEFFATLLADEQSQGAVLIRLRQGVLVQIQAASTPEGRSRSSGHQGGVGLLEGAAHGWADEWTKPFQCP